MTTTARNGHVVLAEADSAPYGSLRQRPTSRKERYAMGKALRKKVPRSSLGRWEVRADRPDPVELIQQSHQGRLDWLVPTRVARMVGSPYGFLRGSAIVMAADVAALPATGITPVICGDAHLGNFGFYASPEGELVIDLNDFDEAHPGGWEWDLRRLVASIWVAGRENGSSEEQCADSVASCVRAYRDEVRVPGRRAAADALLQPAGRRPAARDRHREDPAGRDRAVGQAGPPPHVGPGAAPVHPRAPRPATDRRGAAADHPRDAGRGGRDRAALDAYLETLAPHWRRVVGGYTILDVAHKVVGVGSVGLRAYVVLLEGSSPDDVLFLQLKQARRSVLAPYVHGESAWHAHQGQRVVEYQQALQTVSDPLLGWTTVGEFQYYVRQFRNMKGTIPLDAIDSAALTDYAGIVGHLLAKGHARTSGASMIAGYFGKGDNIEQAMCRFAAAYANQTEVDHAAFVAAARAGRLPIEKGALDRVGSAFRP